MVDESRQSELWRGGRKAAAEIFDAHSKHTHTRTHITRRVYSETELVVQLNG